MADRWAGIVARLVRHMPAPVLLNPERVTIKAAVTLIGVTALVAVRPSSLSALLPHWVIYVWGVTWLLGGLFGLGGYWLSYRPVEMAGHRLIVLGATVYAVAIGVRVGAPAYAVIVLVGFVAVPSIVRMLIASAARLSRKNSGR